MSRTVHVVLFRGVGGKTQLPVKRLKAVLEETGFEQVATYINSGNAVLASGLPRSETVKEVAEAVRAAFGFDKAIFAPTRGDWTQLIEANPFPKAVATPKFLHAALLAEAPGKEAVAAVRAHATPREGFEVVGKVAYIHTPDGFGRSKLAERFDKAIGVENTARNWNSVLALADLADAVKI